MPPAVRVENLYKHFGKTTALNGISLNVDSGEIYGLVGPNGAGKTTALRILATLLKPSGGTAKVLEYDVVRDAAKVREVISYLPEEAGAYKYITGLEYLKLMAALYAKSKSEAEEMVDDAATISGLGDRLEDKTGEYSKGMLRRLLVARALMMRPRLAILDEPTSGLDVLHAHYVRKTIKDYVAKYEVTAIISSHNMLEVEFLCDRVGLIHQGKILEEGSPKKLMDKYGVENLEQAFMKVVELA